MQLGQSTSSVGAALRPQASQGRRAVSAGFVVLTSDTVTVATASVKPVPEYFQRHPVPARKPLDTMRAMRQSSILLSRTATVRRSRILRVALGALLVAASVGCKRDYEAEAAKAEKDMHDRAVARDEARRQQEAAENARGAGQAGVEAERERVAQQARRRFIEKRTNEYAAMSATERSQAMREACGADGCDPDRVEAILAASSGPERAKLQAMVDAGERRGALASRKALAYELDRDLLDRHLNPDGVRVDGTTLSVNGWFCSRQFLHDMESSGWTTRAKLVGFTKLDCRGYWTEL